MPPRRRNTSSTPDALLRDSQWMRDDFEQHKTRPIGSKEFIRGQDWKKIMENPQVETLLEHCGMKEPQRLKILEGARSRLFLKSLSTLVRLRYPFLFQDLFNFLDRPEQTHINALPLTEDILQQIWPSDRPAVDGFLSEQFFFCPESFTLYQSKVVPEDPLQFLYQARFAILEKHFLSKGGSCEVFLFNIAKGYATFDNNKTRDDCTVAVKVYDNPEAFEWETDILRRLAKHHRKHDRLVSVQGAYMHMGKPHVVLPYFKYGDLHSFLEYSASERPNDREPNPSRDFIQQFWKGSQENIGHILTQFHLVVDALHHLHEFDQNDQIVVHGDIKPQNILIGVNENGPFLAVADFGLSEHFVRHPKLLHNTGNSNSAGPSDESSPLGNPGPRSGSYRSPEELQMPPKLSSQSDVWSAICIFLELLTLFLGGHEAVHAFAEQRRQDCPTDNRNTGFCLRLEGEDGYSQSGERAVPFVRESVEKHLQSLHARHGENAAWVQCAIKLIRRVLVFNKSNIKDRPNSGEVHRMLGRVLHHFKNPQRSCTCHASLPEYRFPPLSPSRQPATARPAPISTSSAPPTEPQWTMPVLSSSEPPSPYPTLRRDSLQRWDDDSETRLFHLVSGSPKAKDACISSEAAVIAWLYGNGHLRFSKIKANVNDVSFGTLQIEDLDEAGHSWNWEGIECAGDYIAVWKLSETGGRSEARLFDGLGAGKLQKIMTNQVIDHFDFMRVGSNGHFVCLRKSVLLVLFRGQMIAQADSPLFRLPRECNKFRDVRFNSDGDKLYAWSCGSHNTECLSVWTFAVRDPSAVPTRDDFLYEADRERKPNISLMPFNTRLGCAVQRVDSNTSNCFLAFPCNIRHIHERKHDKSFGTGSFKAVILRDASLVRLVKGQAAKVVTSDLNSDHPFDEPKELFTLKKTPNSEAVLAVIEHEQQHLGVVVHMSGEVEVARFAE